MQAANIPGYLPPTTYRTEAEMKNSDQFLVLIELVHAQWAVDIVTDAVKRQVLQDCVFLILSTSPVHTQSGLDYVSLRCRDYEPPP